MTVVVNDTFTRTSTTTLGTADSGQSWTNLVGVSGTTGTQAYCPTTQINVATIGAGISDVDIQVTLVTVAGNGAGPVYRVTDANNFYLFDEYTGSTDLMKFVAGSYTVLAHLAGSGTSGDVQRVTAIGNVHTAYINGVQKASVTDSSLTATNTHGLRITNNASRMDNLTISSVGVTGSAAVTLGFTGATAVTGAAAVTFAFTGTVPGSGVTGAAAVTFAYSGAVPSVGPVTYLVEMGFQSNPFSASVTWTDVTNQCLHGNIKRGRQYELGRAETGTADLQMLNLDGRFDPTNTSGAYYPNVLPYRPVRIKATYNGTTYTLFYGYVESWKQAWDKSGPATVEVACVDAFATVLGYKLGVPYEQKVFADRGAFAPIVWAFDETAPPFTDYINATNNWVGAGTTANITKSTTDAANRSSVVFGTGCAMYFLAPFDGAGDVEGWFKIPSTWSPVAGETVTLMVDTNSSTVAVTTSLCPKWQTGSILPRYGGDAAALISGGSMFAYKPVPNLMPSANNASFETSVAGWSNDVGTWTLSRDTGGGTDGSASMHLSLPSGTSGRNVKAICTTAITATAGTVYTLSYAFKQTTPSNSDALVPIIRFYNASSVLISEVSGTSSTGASSMSAFTAANAASFTAPALTASMKVGFQIVSSIGSGTGSDIYVDSLMLYANNASVPAATPVYYAAPGASTTTRFIAYLEGANTGTSTAAASVYDLPMPATDVWTLFSWVTPRDVTIRGSGTSFFAINGVAQTVTTTTARGHATLAASSGRYLWIGGVGSTPAMTFPNLKVDDLLLAGYSGTVGSVSLSAQHYNYATNAAGFPKWQDFPEQLTSERITRVLDAIGFPSALRTIDTGASTLVATGSQDGVSALEVILKAADAELGYLFIDGSGKVVFHNRHHRDGAASAATFGDRPDLGEWPYLPDMTVVMDPTYIYNDVKVTQEGVDPSRTSEWQDTTSQGKYLIRSLSQSHGLRDYTDVDGMAQTFLARYKDPLPRVERITVEGRSYLTLLPQALGREIGEVVTVKRRPMGAQPITLTLVVEGLEHHFDVKDGKHETTWLLDPLPTTATY